MILVYHAKMKTSLKFDRRKATATMSPPGITLISGGPKGCAQGSVHSGTIRVGSGQTSKNNLRMHRFISKGWRLSDSRCLSTIPNQILAEQYDTLNPGKAQEARLKNNHPHSCWSGRLSPSKSNYRGNSWATSGWIWGKTVNFRDCESGLQAMYIFNGHE